MEKEIKTYHLENDNIRFSLINLGSTIVQLDVKLKDGTWQESILAYENIEDYKSDQVYLNSVIGPYAGRIKDASFKINDRYYYISPNENQNLLHSGIDGLQDKYFTIEQNDTKIVASYSEQEVDTQFPGSSVYQISYTLLADGLQIDIYALPNEYTLLNMTQHTYFNLNQKKPTIHDTKLQIDANEMYVLDKQSIPVEKKLIEKASVFDFRETKQIEDVLNKEDSQFQITGNIDHPYHINTWPIIVESDKLKLEVYSDAPDCIIYLSNTIANGHRRFKNIGVAKNHAAIAIEPQMYPNEINMVDKSKQIYGQGESFRRQIIYRFYPK